MTLAPPPTAAATPDAVLAERFAANCRALGLDLPTPPVDACVARDGSTTAKRDGGWLAGCSVPRLAAERMIRKENWPHRTLCLMTPTHGQQLAAVLAKLPPTSALIAVFASADGLAEVLACCDVAADASAGRLHVAFDESSLAAVFDRHPGLAVPRQIVRLPDADAADAAQTMPWTQATLTVVAGRHAARVAAASQASPTSPTSQASPVPDVPACVLAGRRFRLWHDVGHALVRTLTDEVAPDAAADAADQAVSEAHSPHRSAAHAAASSARPTALSTAARGSLPPMAVLDVDHPLAGADAWGAERVGAAAGTIADRARPAWATTARPWVAWLTGDDVPAFDPAFAADALMLTRPAAVAAAHAAGWPAGRVTLAGWPNQNLPHTPGGPLALLYDLPDLAPPADVAEFSSRQIVWEAIREELSRDPFALGDDAERYVRRAPARLGLPTPDDFPVRRFLDGIVGPAFAVGVATWLAARGVAFTLHGRGWDTIDCVTSVYRGPVVDRRAFETIVRESGGVIDAFPSPAHPCRALGVPVLTVFGRTPPRVAQDLATILSGRARTPTAPTPLTLATLRQLLAGSV